MNRAAPRTDPTTRSMIATLEEGLTRQRGRPVRIRTLRREFMRLRSSSFRIERLHVMPERGRPFRVFFKDLNPEHLMPDARQVRPADLEAGHRELQMYGSVLSPERFGTPRLYASRWDPERGRLWLFLEDAGRTRLHRTLDMVRWTAAARWAARFHAATRDLPQAQTRFLPRHDEQHYRRCIERMERLLPSLDTSERALVEEGIACFTDRIPWLSGLPHCVVHGQYFGENVMWRGRRVHRICVIDWETAALGPGTLDLVSLSSGHWTKKQRQAMWTAYLQEYEAAAGRPVDAVAFRQELAAVALGQALQWLAWWGDHRSSKHFSNFMRELRALLEQRVPR